MIASNISVWDMIHTRTCTHTHTHTYTHMRACTHTHAHAHTHTHIHTCMPLHMYRMSAIFVTTTFLSQNFHEVLLQLLVTTKQCENITAIIGILILYTYIITASKTGIYCYNSQSTFSIHYHHTLCHI